MKASRRHQRFIRRLETRFSAGEQNYTGISSDFSAGGLFVRTNHAFVPGTVVDLVVHLPDGMQSKLKGKVRRALKTTVSVLKNGMGIELVETDGNYADFIRSFSDEKSENQKTENRSGEGGNAAPDMRPEFVIVSCPQCRVKNKVKKLKLHLGPRCGKCGNALMAV